MRAFQRLILPALAFTLISCAGLAPKVSHRELSPAQRKLIRTTPVVDIHVHSFNSKDLPIRGILLGKRDIHPLAVLFSSKDALALATIIDEVTTRNEQGLACERAMFKEGGLIIENCTKAVNRRLPAHDQVAGRDLSSMIEVKAMAKVAAGDVSMLTAREYNALERISRSFGSHPGLVPYLVSNIGQWYSRLGEGGVVHFFNTLTRSNSQFIGRYLVDHYPQRKRPSDEQIPHRVNHLVSHMMDLAPIYNQREGDLVLNDRIAQLSRMKARMAEAKSRKVKMEFFAAYCPFRDHWPEGASESSGLSYLKMAVHQYGATGIKIYPPSGYRPIGNKIPSRPCSIFSRHPRDQWDARYHPSDGRLTNAELDERLLRVFLFAAREGLPIFTHCGLGEFEARKGYGAYHSHPKYWKQLLESRPELRNLKICFGHAGGEAFWLGDEKNADWGKMVYEMCITYPNVYCEFGAMDHMSDKKARNYFIRHVSELIGEGKEAPFRFEDKVIYGSDYFMPRSGWDTFDNFLRAYQLAAVKIEENGVDGFYRKFFRTNALRFLGK